MVVIAVKCWGTCWGKSQDILSFLGLKLLALQKQVTFVPIALRFNLHFLAFEYTIASVSILTDWKLSLILVHGQRPLKVKL